MNTTFLDAVSQFSNGQSVRSIEKVVTSIQTKEGAGFSYSPPISNTITEFYRSIFATGSYGATRPCARSS